MTICIGVLAQDWIVPLPAPRVCSPSAFGFQVLVESFIEILFIEDGMTPGMNFPSS